jgi:hypothetical protein
VSAIAASSIGDPSNTEESRAADRGYGTKVPREG